MRGELRDPLLFKVAYELWRFKELKREVTDDMLLRILREQGYDITRRDLLRILMKLELAGKIRVERISRSEKSGAQYKIRVL